MRIKYTVSCLLLCLPVSVFVSSSVFAQSGEKLTAQQELERKQELEHKTYSLVDEIASGALALRLPENRSFVLATAADLLWKHDEARARNLFWDALNTINLMNTAAANAGSKGDQSDKPAKPSAKEKEKILSQYFAVFAMRNELLRRVARRDPQLALEMLRNSRQLPVDPLYANFRIPDDRELEQQIAAEAVLRDPMRALQMARESLAKGFSFQLLNLLDQLNHQSPELGTKFAGDVINRLQGRNLAADLYAARIAISLLVMSRSPGESAGARFSSGASHALKLEGEQRRALVEMITNAALEGSADGNLLFSLDEVMPDVEQFVPERVALLQRKLAAFNQTLNREQKLSQEYNSIVRGGTPEELLKLANRAGDDSREWMQRQAVVLAVMQHRADALRTFANNEIEDQSQRKDVLDALDAEQIDFASDKGDVEELQKLLTQIRRKEERARAMTKIAIVLQKKGNHDEALKMLDEAQTLVKTDLNSETQTNALLALVAAYALVEPAKAFGIIERTIDRANDEVAKALLLDKFVNSGVVRKGEIRLQAGLIPIDFAVFKFGGGVAALAKADFERTKAAADRFERNELRLMARLLLAQTLLRVDEPTPRDREQ